MFYRLEGSDYLVDLGGLRSYDFAGAGGQDLTTHKQPEGLHDFTYGPWHIDYLARTASYASSEVPFSKSEFLIFSILSQYPGVALSNHQITQAIWGDWFSDYHHIHVHINRLRQKIRKVGGDPSIVKTVRGFGYLLNTSLY